MTILKSNICDYKKRINSLFYHEFSILNICEQEIYIE